MYYEFTKAYYEFTEAWSKVLKERSYVEEPDAKKVHTKWTLPAKGLKPYLRLSRWDESVQKYPEATRLKSALNTWLWINYGDRAQKIYDYVSVTYKIVTHA